MGLLKHSLRRSGPSEERHENIIDASVRTASVAHARRTRVEVRTAAVLREKRRVCVPLQRRQQIIVPWTCRDLPAEEAISGRDIFAEGFRVVRTRRNAFGDIYAPLV